MTLKTLGQTTHFIVQFDDTVGPAAVAAGNAVLAICEADLAKLAAYIPYDTGGNDPFVNPQIFVKIFNDPVNGPGFSEGTNSGRLIGYPSIININPLSGPTTGITDDYAGFVFVAEMAEILMSDYGWDPSSSQGEALSRVMAEQLHPASSSNFVNKWLSMPRPRPDYISQNELTIPGSISPRGDADPIGYGCGIIFIYFLRSQLNYDFFNIVSAGGTLLSDRYRELTGATDDPATRVGALLDSHFGSGQIHIGGNNPFPLYDGNNRKVYLNLGLPATTGQLLPQRGIAHIRPYFSCPVAAYPYVELGITVTQTITATSVGFGFPSYAWSINGTPLILYGSETTKSIIVPVDIPDPQSPGNPQHQSKALKFDYKITNIFDATGGRSLLSFTNRSFDGDYHLDIRVDVVEGAVPDVPVSAEQSTIVSTRTVVYEGSYESDRQRCAQVFAEVNTRYVNRLQDILAGLHKILPDPPPGELSRIVESIDQIREALAQIARDDPAIAGRLAEYAAIEAGLSADLLLKGAGAGQGQPH